MFPCLFPVSLMIIYLLEWYKYFLNYMYSCRGKILKVRFSRVWIQCECIPRGKASTRPLQKRVVLTQHSISRDAPFYNTAAGNEGKAKSLGESLAWKARAHASYERALVYDGYSTSPADCDVFGLRHSYIQVRSATTYSVYSLAICKVVASSRRVMGF